MDTGTKNGVSDKLKAHKKPREGVFLSLSIEEWNSAYALP